MQRLLFSKTGMHQGDSLILWYPWPFLWLSTRSLVPFPAHSIQLNAWYLDDGAYIDGLERTLGDLGVLERSLVQISLKRNQRECEVSILLDTVDALIRDTLVKCINVKLPGNAWSQVTLPLRFRGLGERSVADLALPCYIYIYMYILHHLVSWAGASDIYSCMWSHCTRVFVVCGGGVSGQVPQLWHAWRTGCHESESMGWHISSHGMISSRQPTRFVVPGYWQ